MRRVWIVAAGLVLAVAATGLWATAPNSRPTCQPLASGDSVACSTIDGFPVGQFESECSPQSDACVNSQTLAALDTRDRGHAPIERVRRYEIDLGRTCPPGRICLRTGGLTILVFDLADGSRHAIGVGCAGIGPCSAVPQYDGPWG
jgi:hypothetical protein